LFERTIALRMFTTLSPLMSTFRFQFELPDGAKNMFCTEAHAILNVRKVILLLLFLIIYYRKSVCNVVSMKLVFEE
jgi:hypothetical protein